MVVYERLYLAVSALIRYALRIKFDHFDFTFQVMLQLKIQYNNHSITNNIINKISQYFLMRFTFIYLIS